MTVFGPLYMSTDSIKRTKCRVKSKERNVAEVYADRLSDISNKKPDNKSIPKGSNNGILQLILLEFWTLSIV
jgi:hypothetical protein